MGGAHDPSGRGERYGESHSNVVASLKYQYRTKAVMVVNTIGNSLDNFENGDETKINYYHAHVYYGEDDAMREKASRLREKVWNKWRSRVRMGRFRDSAVGPHPQAMFLSLIHI